MKLFASFAAGLLFAAGLAVSGMTQPAKIVGFLDFFGRWDPTLLFVMAGAIGVYAVAVRILPRGKATPVWANAYCLPTAPPPDRKLLLGAGIFGIGWGVGGMCPGPMLTAAGSGAVEAAIACTAMLAGMLLYRLSE